MRVLRLPPGIAAGAPEAAEAGLNLLQLPEQLPPCMDLRGTFKLRSPAERSRLSAEEASGWIAAMGGAGAVIGRSLPEC